MSKNNKKSKSLDTQYTEKNESEIDIQKVKETENHDLEYEMDEEFAQISGEEGKLKKLREQLKIEKEKTQEYLTGWQKERADFANYKSGEEKSRKERLDTMKLNLIADFFPVLDSFDMAFSNKESWEKVDPAWRTGVEYIYTQFMSTLENYNISVIDSLDVSFDPMIHEPAEQISVETEDKHDIVLGVIQKGYRSGDIVLRPAKVKIGKYEN